MELVIQNFAEAKNDCDDEVALELPLRRVRDLRTVLVCIFNCRWTTMRSIEWCIGSWSKHKYSLTSCHVSTDLTRCENSSAIHSKELTSLVEVVLIAGASHTDLCWYKVSVNHPRRRWIETWLSWYWKGCSSVNAILLVHNRLVHSISIFISTYFDSDNSLSSIALVRVSSSPWTELATGWETRIASAQTSSS